jgi:hypothetical protein
MFETAQDMIGAGPCTSKQSEKRREFCKETQLKMEEDGFVERLISDEATFHFSGKVNRHSVHF